MGARINWYEKPNVVRMTSKELYWEMVSQKSYFDVSPNPIFTDIEKEQHVDEVMIYDDEGFVYLKAKRQSKNSWRVQTTFA